MRKLLRRHDSSCQVPVRPAMERDEEAVAAWKAGVAGDKSTARDRGSASPFAGILIGQPTVARQLRTGTRPPLTCYRNESVRIAAGVKCAYDISDRREPSGRSRGFPGSGVPLPG